MNIFKKYSEYIKDNPNNYWFKRKLYGWGWVPATWQGFMVVFIYISVVLLLASSLNNDSPTNEVVFVFVLPTILLTITLLRICYKKGEKPKWQWGRQDDTQQE